MGTLGRAAQLSRPTGDFDWPGSSTASDAAACANPGKWSRPWAPDMPQMALSSLELWPQTRLQLRTRSRNRASSCTEGNARVQNWPARHGSTLCRPRGPEEAQKLLELHVRHVEFMPIHANPKTVARVNTKLRQIHPQRDKSSPPGSDTMAELCPACACNFGRQPRRFSSWSWCKRRALFAVGAAASKGNPEAKI